MPPELTISRGRLSQLHMMTSEEGWVIEEDHWHPAIPPEEVEVSGKGKCKKKGQNEGLTTPAGKVKAEEGVSPDGAVVSSKTAGGRALFAEK